MNTKCAAAFRSRKCLGQVDKSSPTYACDRCGHERRYCAECAGTWIVSLAKIAEKEQRRSTLHDIITRVNSERWYRKGFSNLIKHQACEKECGGVYCPSANVPTFEDIAEMKPPVHSLEARAAPAARQRSGEQRPTRIDTTDEGEDRVKTREKIARQRERELANQLAIAEVKRAIEVKKKEEEEVKKKEGEPEEAKFWQCDVCNMPRNSDDADRCTKCWALRGAKAESEKPRPCKPRGSKDMPPLEDGGITALRKEMRAMNEAHRLELMALRQTFTAEITRMQREVIDVCGRLNAKVDAIGAAHVDLARRISDLETPSWMTSGSSNLWSDTPAL